MLSPKDKKDLKEMMINVFNEGVDQLINPQFESLDQKFEDRFNELQNNDDRIERKLDAVIRVQDDHSIKIGKM